ncbi:hypothetical protein [Undibacter mobilis]|uniref:Flagellar hook protein FlgE n=1 Tax=Undibacter mobilis TaxID=2292256 RepID=A0A371B3M6_9BRAD|nr:hypothetical protein [Undibacter mobilis]RDV02150.1 hypothetical protein DXH78_16265 [Undibacter mobilis]
MSSIGGISSSISGLMAASQKMQAAMIKMANASDGGDMAALLAEQVTSQASFAANAQTLKAQVQGVGELLDIMA